QSVLDARAGQHPGDETVAVRAGPVSIEGAMRITCWVGEHLCDPRRLVAGPRRREARRPAADAVCGRLEVAVHVSEARATCVLRLPYFPAVARAGVFVDHEPVMHGDQADQRQRRITELDFQCESLLAFSS